jgi:hypothetical protein
MFFGGVGVIVYPPENSGIMAGKLKSSGKAEDDLEIVPDAWERFERAIDVVIRSGPKHRQTAPAKPKERAPSKGRVLKSKPHA